MKSWFLSAGAAVVESEVPSVAVLAAPRDAAAVGAAAGLALARCVLVCSWGPGALGPRAPAAPAAGRLAEALASREIEAAVSGRLVRVGLPDDEDEALAVFRRAAAARNDAAVVLAVGAARNEHIDGALFDQDRVLVCARRGEERFAAVAAERLGHPMVRTCVADPTPAGRAMALAGLWIAPCLRPVAEAVA